ncbi:septation protein SepH, partial [Williamsia sp.]|uniref:septation protein SepH n=1 Tax=Williamsia sp. TaxID=1872085 RepID=UPI001A2DCDB6
MRELRVIGLEADGSSVVCQDPESGEKFHIAADDRLRAAARGDLSRLGQIEIEMESSLRPREIQSRIRAGASVAQVAAAAGVTADKVARFAHPVLLERSRAAELASSAHPIRVDGPALSTLSEVVAAALGARGHNPDDTTWDAWKGEDNRWVVQVSWRVGRSENHAHWRYLPGSSGGAVEPLDETADEITDPDMSRPLRGLTSVATFASSPTAEFTVEADEVIGAQRARHEDPDPFDSAPREPAPRTAKAPDPEPIEAEPYEA